VGALPAPDFYVKSKKSNALGKRIDIIYGYLPKKAELTNPVNSKLLTFYNMQLLDASLRKRIIRLKNQHIFNIRQL